MGIQLTRYLVETATGAFTGSIYHDDGIYQAGHLGELRDYKDGSTLVQKTHHSVVLPGQSWTFSLTQRMKHIQQFGGRGVLVIRNPYKAFISHWNYFKTGSQTKSAALESLDSEEFKDFVIDQADKWLEVNQDWLRLSTSCHVIFYEVTQVVIHRANCKAISV